MPLIHPYVEALIREQSFQLMSRASIVSVSDLQGVIIYANDHFFQKYGYTIGEIIGETHDILLSESQTSEFWQRVGAQLHSGQAWQGEVRHRAKNGEYYWIHSQVMPIQTPEGELVAFMAIGNDITELYQTREALMQQNTHLNALIEAIPDAIFLKDGESRWLVTNPTAKSFFRLDTIDWQGKKELELAAMQPEFREVHEMCYTDDEIAWNAGKLTFFTEFVTDEYGNTAEFEVRKMPVFNQDGSRMALVIVGTDVTDRKRQEAELVRAQRMLEKTMQMARIGGWEVDVQANTVIWSGITRELAQVADDYTPQMEQMLAFYKEGPSREAMREAFQLALEAGKSFDITVELNSGAWIRTIAEPVVEAGKTSKIFGYIQDITESIKLNKINENIEKRFYHLIEKGENAILLQNAKAEIIYVSPAVERILGYPPSEIVGHKSDEFFPPDELSAIIGRRHEIQQHPGVSFPLMATRLRHKNGHYVQVEGSLTNMLHDPAIQAIVSNFRDITERSRYEARLQQKNARLEQIAWLFSHEVRGPITTIEGILSLLDFGNPQAASNLQLIPLLEIPLKRLDEVISDIVLKTDELENE